MGVLSGLVALTAALALLPAAGTGPPPAGASTKVRIHGVAPALDVGAGAPAGDSLDDPAPRGSMPVDLQRFALNALLVPLLDDAEPVRWADVALTETCGPGTRVTVDGRPLVPGTEVPATAFTVRWSMDYCAPLGHESVELTGTVELLVFREDLGLGAVVMAQGLHVNSALGSARLPNRFAAYTALIPEPPRRGARGR